MITTRVLASVLLGVNEQVNCSNCVSAFGSAGSFSAGVHGRYNITDSLSIMGGIAYARFNENGFNVTSAPIGAFALRYDFTEWGKSRPFFDVGTVLSPDQHVSYYRSYISSLGPTQVTSNTTGLELFGVRARRLDCPLDAARRVRGRRRAMAGLAARPRLSGAGHARQSLQRHFPTAPTALIWLA